MTPLPAREAYWDAPTFVTNDSSLLIALGHDAKIRSPAGALLRLTEQNRSIHLAAELTVSSQFSDRAPDEPTRRPLRPAFLARR